MIQWFGIYFSKEEKYQELVINSSSKRKQKHLIKIDLKKLILAIHIHQQDRGCSLSVFPSKELWIEKVLKNEFIQIDLYQIHVQIIFFHRIQQPILNVRIRIFMNILTKTSSFISFCFFVTTNLITFESDGLENSL